MLLKSSLIFFKLLRTSASSSNQLLRLSPHPCSFFLPPTQQLIVLHNGVRHYGTSHKHRGNWLMRISWDAARARSTSNGVPRPPKISLQAEGSLEISSPCITVQGGSVITCTSILCVSAVIILQFRLPRLNRRPIITRTTRRRTSNLLTSRRLLRLSTRFLLPSIRKP
ncbi:hypothetical protein HanRHA438_Chr02g0053401 [Helianthus annuus]|nr:hypothetical protein HanRHA438_Chr02g0053401 [Helianthus annuus]